MQTVFLVRLRKQIKNCPEFFEGPIRILGTHVFFSGGGRKPEAQKCFQVSLDAAAATRMQQLTQASTALGASGQAVDAFYK